MNTNEIDCSNSVSDGLDQPEPLNSLTAETVTGDDITNTSLDKEELQGKKNIGFSFCAVNRYIFEFIVLYIVIVVSEIFKSTKPFISVRPARRSERLKTLTEVDVDANTNGTIQKYIKFSVFCFFFSMR